MSSLGINMSSLNINRGSYTGSDTSSSLASDEDASYLGNPPLDSTPHKNFPANKPSSFSSDSFSSSFSSDISSDDEASDPNELPPRGLVRSITSNHLSSLNLMRSITPGLPSSDHVSQNSFPAKRSLSSSSDSELDASDDSSYSSFSSDSESDSELDASNHLASRRSTSDSETLTPSSGATSRSATPGEPSSDRASQNNSPAASSQASSLTNNNTLLIQHAKRLHAALKTNSYYQEAIALLSAQAITPKENGKTQAQAGLIAKQCPVLVTGTGELFLLFNRTQPFGEGSFKQYHDAVSTRTWTIVGVCSPQPDAMSSIQGTTDAKETAQYLLSLFRKDYKNLKHLSNRIIPKSYVHGETPCWLETKLQGDLFDGLDDKLIDIEDASTRFDLAKQMAEELARIHEQKKVHRDVKPENYLFTHTQEGSLKIAITDFGFTIDIGDRKAPIAGTNDYLPPQSFQLRHCPSHFIQHDSWSLGVSLLEIFEDVLDQTYLLHNPKCKAFLSKIQNPERLSIWQELNWRLKPLTQDQWLKQPANEKSLEFVIWKLLQISPQDRWTARQAADALRELHLNHQVDESKIAAASSQ